MILAKDSKEERHHSLITIFFLYKLRLPQLAVSAKILCLLMVVICGAVPSMVRSVRLYSQCSHLYVNVFPNGTVMALSGENDHPDLNIIARSFTLDLLLHSPAHDLYLCFNRSRLVGRNLTLTQAEKHPNCLFKEEFVEGYNRYHLVKNKDRYIGFNARGLQIRRPLRILPKRMYKCVSFMKDARDFDITKHNRERANQPQPQQVSIVPKWRPQRRLRGPSQFPCIRHNHGRHSNRRRNCHGT